MPVGPLPSRLPAPSALRNPANMIGPGVDFGMHFVLAAFLGYLCRSQILKVQ